MVLKTQGQNKAILAKYTQIYAFSLCNIISNTLANESDLIREGLKNKFIKETFPDNQHTKHLIS